MENVSVQSDSRDMFETHASDSDSGDSLFLTQSVTSPSRTVKRQRPYNTQACPFSQAVEQEKDLDPNTQREDSSSSDSNTSYADWLRRWKSLRKRHGTIGRLPRPRLRRLPLRKIDLPFLKSGSGLVYGCRNRTIVNSEIGGFFKCVQKLHKEEEDRRRELSPSFLDSEWEQNSTEEEDDDDIRKVNRDFFVLTAPKRNHQTWLPGLKWKTSQASRKSTKKSNESKEAQEKCNQTRNDAEDLMELQDDTNVHNMSSSFNMEETLFRKKVAKSPSRSSFSPCSSLSRLSPDKSPIVQSLFMDHQKEHSENQPQVLVTCSQSQTFDWNWMEPIDEIAVEEMQRANLVAQDEEETQILEDDPVDRDGGKDAACSENISFHEHQNEDMHENIPHEPVENKGVGSVSERFISSQDLLQDPDEQASRIKKTNVENDNDVDLESGMVVHDDVDSIKKKKERCLLILAAVESDCVTPSKSQRIQSTEINSSTGRDICQEWKEKDDGVEHEHPSLPLEDYSTGSRGNDFSSPCKDSLMIRHEGKPDTPLFVYGGLNFLKRKKGKKTQVHEISDKSTPEQAVSGQNKVCDIVMQTKRKKNKNYVEPGDTLPEVSVSANLHLSAQDCSVVCASVSRIIQKKKGKKDKIDGLLVEPVDTLPESCVDADSVSSHQDSCIVSASIDGSKVKKKSKNDKHDDYILEATDLSIASISHEVSQLDNSTQVNKDLVQSDGLKPQRKKKRKSSPVLSDEIIASQCSEESHSSHGITNVKKRMKKHLDEVGEVLTANRSLAEPLDKIYKISANEEIQPVNRVDLKMDDTVTLRKKKKKRRQYMFWEENMDVEVSLVETTEQVETSDTFQDSEQQLSEEVLMRKVKKKKKKKIRTETHQEDEVSKNTPESLTLGCGKITATDIPSTRCETEGICEGDYLHIAKPEKMKKKKNKKGKTEHTIVVEEASESGQIFGKENTAPCLETHLPNHAKDKKKHNLNKSQDSECSQEILQSEDTTEPEEMSKKKKRKKRLVETDMELFSEIVDHEISLEAPETIIKEKKKKKDRVDAGQKANLDVLPEASAAEESRDILVICHANEDSVSTPEGGLLVNIKKKKKKKNCKESHSSHGITNVKKRMKKHLDEVGEVLTANRSLAEPLDKICKISANEEIQPVNRVDLKMDDTVTLRKKKKKRRQYMFWEENMDVEVSLVETTEQVETSDTFQDSEQQLSEEVLMRKVKKKKKKKITTETHQEDEVSKNTPKSLTLGCGKITATDIPSTRCETEGICEGDYLRIAKPEKKKKKKGKTEHTIVVEEASESGQIFGKENTAPCLETHLPNHAKDKKKHNLNKSQGSECSQEILQSEDTIEPEEMSKKKKKRLVETDMELFSEIVDHEISSEAPETIIEEKKKKKKKDRVDAGQKASLDVLPEASAAEESRDILVICHANQDSVSTPEGGLLVNIKKKKKKKKKKVRDLDNLETKIGSENSCQRKERHCL